MTLFPSSGIASAHTTSAVGSCTSGRRVGATSRAEQSEARTTISFEKATLLLSSTGKLRPPPLTPL